MRKRLKTFLLTVFIFVGFLLTGACGPDPCRTVPRADQNLINQVQQRPDIEFEAVGEHDAECVLTPDGRWVQDAD